jgi:hypothetical protein
VLLLPVPLTLKGELLSISSFDGEQVVLGALIYGKEEYENYATKS